MEILHFRGHTGPYLEPAPGAASLNLFKMAREGLLAGLQTAIKAARRKNVSDRSEGLRVESGGGEKLVSIHLVPIRSSLTDEHNFLVLFEDCTGKIPPADEQNRPRRGRSADKHSAQRVLTTFNGNEDIYRSLRAGAKAYLLKDAPRDELLNCIRSVDEGKTWISPLAAANLAARLSEEALTPRELQVLRLVAAGKSNKEVAAALFVTEGTVKVHVNHILAKLNVAGRTEAIAQAVKRGIVHFD